MLTKSKATLISQRLKKLDSQLNALYKKVAKGNTSSTMYKKVQASLMTAKKLDNSLHNSVSGMKELTRISASHKVRNLFNTSSNVFGKAKLLKAMLVKANDFVDTDLPEDKDVAEHFDILPESTGQDEMVKARKLIRKLKAQLKAKELDDDGNEVDDADVDEDDAYDTDTTSKCKAKKLKAKRLRAKELDDDGNEVDDADVDEDDAYDTDNDLTSGDDLDDTDDDIDDTDDVTAKELDDDGNEVDDADVDEDDAYDTETAPAVSSRKKLKAKKRQLVATKTSLKASSNDLSSLWNFTGRSY